MYRACSSLATFIARGAPPPAAAFAASAAGSATVRQSRGFIQRRAPRMPASASCERPATGFVSVQAIGSPASTEAIERQEEGRLELVARDPEAAARLARDDRRQVDEYRLGVAEQDVRGRRVLELPAARQQRARKLERQRTRGRQHLRRPFGRLADEFDALVLEALAVEVGELRRRLDARQRARADDAALVHPAPHHRVLEHAPERVQRMPAHGAYQSAFMLDQRGVGVAKGTGARERGGQRGVTAGRRLGAVLGRRRLASREQRKDLDPQFAEIEDRARNAGADHLQQHRARARIDVRGSRRDRRDRDQRAHRRVLEIGCFMRRTSPVAEAPGPPIRSHFVKTG